MNSSTASDLWRGLLSAKSILRQGVKWQLGDGETLDVWRDWWCGDKPLEEIVTSQHLNMPTELSGLHVKDLIREDGDWDENWATAVFPAPTSALILSQSAPNASAMDLPLWKGAPDGAFSVLSVYELLIGANEIEEDWNWIWKLRLPQKLKTFLWTVCHGKVLTNNMRMKRGLTTDPTCPNCSGEEDINNLFRECYKAKEVWLQIFGKTWYLCLMRKPWNDWLKSNSCNKTHFLETSLGRLKMNIDGCRRAGGEGGFGGLLRDERGAWVCGFYGKMQMGTSLEAELWALYKGLTVILPQGINNVTIETDAAQVVKLMEEPNCQQLSLQEFGGGCKNTLQRL